MSTKNITVSCLSGDKWESERSLIHDISCSITSEDRLCALNKLCDFWKEKNCNNDTIEKALRYGVVSVLIKQLVYILYRGYDNASEPVNIIVDEVELIMQALDIVHKSASKESIQKYSPVQSLLSECVSILKFFPKCQASETKITRSEQIITECATNILLHLSRIVLFDDRRLVSARSASEIMQHLILCMQRPSNVLIQSRSVRALNNFICTIIMCKDQNAYTSKEFSRVLWSDNILERLLSAVVDLFSTLLGTKDCKDQYDINPIDSNDSQTNNFIFATSTLIINITTILKSQPQRAPLLKQKIVKIDETIHKLMSILSISLSMKSSLSRNRNILFKIQFNALNSLLNWTLSWINLMKQPPNEKCTNHIEQECIQLWVITIIPTIIKNYHESNEIKPLSVDESRMDIDMEDPHFELQKNLKNSKKNSAHNEIVLMNEIFKAVNLIVHTTSPEHSYLWIPSMGPLMSVAKSDLKMNNITLLKAMSHLSILLIDKTKSSENEQHSLLAENYSLMHIPFLDALAAATLNCMSNETHHDCYIVAWAYQKLSIHQEWLGQMSKHSGTVSCLIALLLYEGDTSSNESAAVTLLNLSHSETNELSNHIKLLLPALLHSALTNKDLIVNELVLCILIQLADKSESVCSFLMSNTYAQKVVLLFSQAATPPGLVVVGAQKTLQKLLTFDII